MAILYTNILYPFNDHGTSGIQYFYDGRSTPSYDMGYYFARHKLASPIGIRVKMELQAKPCCEKRSENPENILSLQPVGGISRGWDYVHMIIRRHRNEQVPRHSAKYKRLLYILLSKIRIFRLYIIN